MFVKHRRAHGAFATTKGSRPVNTANVTAATYATHAATHSARLVALLVLFVLHLWEGGHEVKIDHSHIHPIHIPGLLSSIRINIPNDDPIIPDHKANIIYKIPIFL